MDFKQMASELGIGEDDFKELAQLLVTTSLEDLRALDEALTNGDAARAAGAAHSIKGAAGNMGFMELSKAAAGIEAGARSGNLEGIRDKASEISRDLEAIRIALGL